MNCVLSAVAISDSLKQSAVPRWYKRNVLAGVRVLGTQGETVSRSSPETPFVLSALLKIVVSALAHVHSPFLILMCILQPNAYNHVLVHVYMRYHGNKKSLGPVLFQLIR